MLYIDINIVVSNFNLVTSLFTRSTDVMIIFKRRRVQRINPLRVKNEDYVSEATEDDKEDTDYHRNSNHTLNDKDAAFIQKDVHRKSKNKRRFLNNRDAHSPIQTKRRRISESDDDDDDSDGDDDSDDDADHVHSQIHEKSRRISESEKDSTDNRENNTNELEMNNGKHLPTQIPSTDKKKYPQKRCVTCTGQGVRNDTRYYCKFCHVALCKDPCFREYHSI